MESALMRMLRGIKADKKRALEITESVATGSPFDRIRVSEADGIESRLLKAKEEILNSKADIDASIIKEVEEGLSAVKGTREIARLRAIGKQRAVEKKETAENRGQLTEEQIAEKLGIKPEIAKRIKENPEAVMREAQETINKLNEKRAMELKSERAEAARKKEKTMEQNPYKKKRFMR